MEYQATVLSKEHATQIKKRLTRAIPKPVCELDHENAWQLLIATILSAQSTDKMVNTVTPKLFARFPTPADLGRANPSEVEKLIKSTGFFRNKTKSIIAASRRIDEEHAGVVPRKMDQMLKLPGVARKTANVVLGTAYRISTGITVDTHAGRVSRRLGLTEETDPKKVERDLMELWHKRSWIDMGHRLVLHGRYVCKSQRPACRHCALFEICPEAEGDKWGRWGARADREREVVESRGAVDLEGEP